MFIGRTDDGLARIAEWTWFNPTFALFGGGLSAKLPSASFGLLISLKLWESCRFFGAFGSPGNLFSFHEMFGFERKQIGPLRRETTNPPNKEVSNQLELQYLGHKPWTNWMFGPNILHEMQWLFMLDAKLFVRYSARIFLLTNCVLGCSLVSHVKSSCKIIKASA